MHDPRPVGSHDERGFLDRVMSDGDDHIGLLDGLV